MADEHDAHPLDPISEPPPPLEWWRRPVYILFKLLPLIVLVVLIWNWMTVTREWEAAKRGEGTEPSAVIEP